MKSFITNSTFLYSVAIFSLMFSSCQLFSQRILPSKIDSNDSFTEKLNKIYATPQHVINYPLLEFTYSPEDYTFPKSIYRGDISPIFNMELRYGFMRKNRKIGVKDLFYNSGEYVFISDMASRLNLSTKSINGNRSDTWKFGFGYRNGYGYEINQKDLMLYHSGSINWSRIDFFDVTDSVGQNQINRYDGIFRFGTTFGCGVNYQIYKSINFNLGYEHSLIFPEYKNEWLGSAGIELVLQRWMDFVEGEMLDINRKKYPIFHFVYKSGVSFMLYKLREKSMYWPFNSEAPLSNQGLKIGFTFVFE